MNPTLSSGTLIRSAGGIQGRGGGGGGGGSFGRKGKRHFPIGKKSQVTRVWAVRMIGRSKQKKAT